MAGSYPKILDNKVVGVEARKLFEDAQVMLKQIISEEWLTARAVVGFFPANSDGDDVIVYTDDTRKQRLETLHPLRQQNIKAPGRPNYCLSDFDLLIARHQQGDSIPVMNTDHTVCQYFRSIRQAGVKE